MALLDHVPDRADPCGSRDAPCRHFGSRNMVVRARARAIQYPVHRGPLSIKCAYGGAEVYEADGARFAVDDGSYLILNDGQDYRSWIEDGPEVESLCVFFRSGFVEEALGSLIMPEDRLLDLPASAGQAASFFEKTYRHDRLISPMIAELAGRIDGGASAGWVDERFHALAERLLRRHRALAREIRRVPAVRRSTRLELFRRLSRAKDYIDASVGEAVDLRSMAGVACMAPHHFLRSFRRTFGESPHQYLTRKRIERARRLLETTSRSAMEICVSVGFESAGSFSSLFRARCGVSPTEYRRRRR